MRKCCWPSYPSEKRHCRGEGTRSGGLPIGYVLSLEGADSIVTFKHLEQSYAEGLRALGAGARVLNELIYECQRSLEGIEHARLDLDARGWARGQGLRE